MPCLKLYNGVAAFPYTKHKSPNTSMMFETLIRQKKNCRSELKPQLWKFPVESMFQPSKIIINKQYVPHSIFSRATQELKYSNMTLTSIQIFAI